MEPPPYKTLDQTVRLGANDEEVTERRLRRWIAASAMLEIIKGAQQIGRIPSFLVKGGFAIELRFRRSARASRDVDVVLPVDSDQLVDLMIEVLRKEWSGFSFQIRGAPEHRERSVRLLVGASYRGRDWSTFEVDLVAGSTERQEVVPPFDTAKFGLMAASLVPCLNALEQIAQKLHAVTNPQENRARDLLDIYLLDTRLDRDDTALLLFVGETFEQRQQHTWPARVELREGWREELEDIISRNGFAASVDDIVEGVRALVLRLTGVPPR